MFKKYSINFLKIFLIYVFILFCSVAFSQTTNKNNEKILHLELDSSQLKIEVPKGKTWEIITVFTSFPFTFISEKQDDYFIFIKSINNNQLTYIEKKGIFTRFYGGPILYSSSHLHVLSLPIILQEKTIIELISVRRWANNSFEIYKNLSPIYVTVIERKI